MTTGGGPTTPGPAFEPDQVFVPGGIWFYAKLYTDVELLTDLASRHLPNALTHLFGLPVQPNSPADGPGAAPTPQRLWFYARYSDPGHHLRLRIRLASGDEAVDALRALRTWGEKLREVNLVSRIELGTYEQETYRFGGLGNIDRAERVFAADSADCVDLLAGPYRGSDVAAHMGSRIAAIWTATGDEDVHRAATRGALLAQKHAAPYEEKRVAIRLDCARVTPPGGTAVEREVTSYYQGLRDSGISTERRIYIARSLAHMHCNRAGAVVATERRAVDAATAIMRSRNRKGSSDLMHAQPGC